jgi:nitrogen fixation protein NifQ
MLQQPIHILSKASQVHQHPEHQHEDEYDDIVLLLKDHGRDDSDETLHVVAYVADACMGSNHLWQDMQLPNRTALSELMQHFFPTLAAKNTADMKWKKFFYKQLCEREDIFICKSPSCGDCVDYNKCFGAED